MRVLFATLLVAAAVAAAALSPEALLVENLRTDYPHASDSELAAAARALRAAPTARADEPAGSAKLGACPPLPPRTPPTNVQDLSPVDIRIVAGVGDSISMGSNALSTTWLNLKRYPGLAWAAGGDEGVVSVANMLKMFSPSIYGASTGSGDNAPLGANYAVAGSVVQDLVPQITAMIAGLKSNPALNYTGDWKVINVLTGGNNLCDVCEDEAPNSAAAYEAGLEAAFELLSTIPRAYVSLVAHLNYVQLHQFKGPFCGLALNFVCKCITTDDTSLRDYTSGVIAQYNAVNVAIADKWNGIRTDFAVVNQPVLIDTVLPDKSYISTADCFHPSGKGQALLAMGVWNNMLQPVGAKSQSVLPTDTVTCPTVDSVFYS